VAIVIQRPNSAWLSRNTLLLALSSLFADISTEMLYPILPVFLTQTLHASGSIVGLVDGMAQATQNIVQGASGWLSDRLGKRKPVALVGYLLAAIAKPLMGMAGNWPGLLGARLTDRLGTGIRSAPRDALVAASVSEKHRGKAFGLEGFSDNLGACVGPLLAVLLIAWAMPIRGIFYLAIVPGLLAFVMVLSVRDQPTAVAAPAKTTTSVRQFPRAYWRYLLATALFGMGNSSNSFLILHTQGVGASLRTTILIYAGYNLVAALVSYPAGFLSDRLGRRNILLVSFAIFFVTYLGFALSHRLALLGSLFVLYGVYQGVFRAVGKALASDLVPDALRATGVGWYSTTIGLLGLVASVIGGLLWDRVDHAAVFLYGAGCAVVGTVALLALVPSRGAGHET
jgi:MFS family permease